VYINYDVVAPHDKDKTVYVRFTDTDGENPDDLFPALDDQSFAAFFSTLSTKARFMRFLKDFRAVEGDRVQATFETIDSVEYAVLRNADLCDFLAKKDYIQSWHSEMHERFCFWEYSDWVSALTEVGFTIGAGSEPKQNSWLIENRFKPAAKVYEIQDSELIELQQPVTNVLLIAQKSLV
jgi:hypothetical protein